jgi:putative heme-binding domain-containing protein
LQALSRLPADAFKPADAPPLAELQRLRRTAAAALIRDARRVLDKQGATLDERVAAIETLGLDVFENHQAIFEQLLSPQEPAAVHAAVLATCARFDAPAVADVILSRWAQLGPSERSQAIELLLRREAWALDLLRHLSQEGVALATLDPSHAAKLQNFPSENVRRLAQKLRGEAVSADRRQVFNDYREAALASGNATHGNHVFEKNCATCHAVDADGDTVGPNLASMVNRGAESLLFNVLAPNGEVDPRYLEYVVLTVDGQVVNGIIAGETSTAVTIRGADNKTTTVLRVDIDEMHNSGKSLMPEGFEKVIDKQAMADLLAYLQEAAAKRGVTK